MPVHLMATRAGLLKEHAKAGLLLEKTAGGWKVEVGSNVVTINLENHVP